MKKMILATATILMCLHMYAQELKPCLFIGLYDENKRGICSDRAMEQENVSDYAEYMVKKEQFTEKYKTQKPTTKFIDKDLAVIIYRYEKEIVGWQCNSKVISIKTGKTIEVCNQQLADQLAKSPKDFTTPPHTFFTWQGKGLSASKTASKSEYTKDYGGLKAKFTSGNTATKDNIVAQFTNYTKDKRATVLIRNGGSDSVQYISPGSTLSLNYKTKQLDIQVIYEDDKSPEPSRGIINSVKDKIWDRLSNENGEIKLRKWDPACMCVRG